MNEADLTQRMQRMLERAYRERDRSRCSREDFADGYIAALVDLRSRSSFLHGRELPPARLPWDGDA